MQKSLTYNDARGKVTRIADGVGFRDTLGSRYSGLGYVDSTSYVARRDTAAAATWSTVQGFFTDGLANLVQSFTMTNVSNRRVGSTTTGSVRQFVYGRGSGRLALDRAGDGETVFEYDSAGNTRFSFRLPAFETSNTTLEDRASYYGADGRLRAADYRQIVKAPGFATPTIMAFEEYRYDALGRRVLVRSRRQCDFVSDRPKGECSLDLVRRTVWDGEQELVEIQMPDSQAERDTGFVALPPTTLTQGTQYFDPNPYFGRVLYTHGLALDHPLSITRVEYTDDPQAPSGTGGQGASRWEPLSIVPIWNDRGKADLFYFAESGEGKHCRVVMTIERCVRGSFPFAWFAYDRSLSPAREWHGTLVEDKEDKSGTLYRRERYYEPTTGRFTQEDPIGLAGGLNLYGFANGDPVTYSDPFGLCPWCIQLFNWWMTTGGPGLARVGAALSGLSLPSSSSSKAVATIAPEVLEGIVAGARTVGTRPGPQIFEAARRIGDLRVSQAAATEAVEKAVLKLGHDVGPTLTIDGVKYVLAKMAFGGKLDAVAVHAGGRITRAVFDPETLKLVSDLGPIAVAR